jgi:ferredoxin
VPTPASVAAIAGEYVARRHRNPQSIFFETAFFSLDNYRMAPAQPASTQPLRITLSPSARSFLTQGEDSLLQAALDAGFVLPYGCRNGACGSCKGKVLEGLVSDAAFMRVAIEEIKVELIKKGMMEKFKNGSQEFMREKPEAKLFLNFMKQYANTMKQLIDLMPVQVKEEEQDQLLQFFQSGKEVIKK